MNIRKSRGPRTDPCGTPAGSNTAYPRLASSNYCRLCAIRKENSIQVKVQCMTTHAVRSKFEEEPLMGNRVKGLREI